MKKFLKRKICVITGTRAEYGLLKPVMKAIDKSQKLELALIVTGMHLSSDYGLTIREIEKDGFKILSKVKMTPTKDTVGEMARSVGRGIIGISKALEKIKPKIVLVLGDRVESLAAAISAAYMNILVAHIHGGDSPRSGLDEYARHAITKFSHIHFPATKKSAERIIKMGEDPERVYIVGAPGLDTILKGKLISPAKIASKYKLDLSKPILMVIQHPVTTDVKNAPRQMKKTMEAIKETGFQTIVIYPNADAGGRKMIKVIEEYREYPFIQAYKSLPHVEYLSLMKAVTAMIGNSSSGIIEAPSFRLPVINIGSRQEGRERAENVIDVNYDKKQIKQAIRKVIYDKNFIKRFKMCRNPYGDGKAGIRIASILSKIKIDKQLLQKKLTY